MDHSLLILCALLLNALLGGPRRWYLASGISRATGFPARAIRHLERKLNRENRSADDRQIRGWCLVVAAVLSSIVLGVIGGWIFRHNLRFIELALVASMLPVRPIWDRAAAIRNALTTIDIPAARQALAGTPWRHHALLDEFGLARAAIETALVEFSEKLVCPILGYLWLGLPGLFICKILTLLRDALAHAPDFGKGAVFSHAVLHTIPSRLSAILWTSTLVFLPESKISVAAKQVTDAFLTDAPRPLCVRTAAAVVRVSLGGPTSPYLTAWAENGTAKATPIDIRRTQACYFFAMIFLFVLVGAFF